MSIRRRLTLWSTCTLAVLLIGVGSLVYGLSSHSSYSRIDKLLSTQYRELEKDERLEADPENRLRHWIEEFHDHVEVFGAVYHTDGTLLTRTEQLADSSVPPFPKDSTSSPTFDTLELPLVGRQRVATATLDTTGQRFVVTLMLPLEETDRELARLRSVLWTVLPLSLVLAGIAGYLLAGRALAPVDRLRREAEGITADHLDRRLDLSNPNDELGRLGSTINSMIGRLERSFDEVRRFTADASHELRTPISVIRTEAEIASKNPSVGESIASFENILEECEYLTRLTDQLLTLSREDAGIAHFEGEPLDFSHLVTEAVNVMRPLAQSKRQTLTLDSEASLYVTGDPARLRQVVYNLLDNAGKYTADGGRIDVVVAGRRERVELVVSDSGVGIEPEHLPHLTKRFYRIDKARSREEGGTGLGLSIVQSICTTHGATLEVASVPGEGTRFTVSLPRTHVEADR